MDQNYLKVGDVEFTDDLSPSDIIPGVEFIKNSERALSGKLHVDITANKQTLQIVFNILDRAEFEQILDIFKLENADAIDPEGLRVTYFDLRSKSQKERRFFVDNTSFAPFIVNDDIKWRDIVIDLIEI